MLSQVLHRFNVDATDCTIEPFGTGLINHTWKVSGTAGVFILQRINHNVFQTPESIAANLDRISAYLAEYKPDYFFVTPVLAADGKSMVHDPEHGYFRLMPFVVGSVTFDTVDTPHLAFEAAAQFGLFAKYISGLDSGGLKVTIPHFHDLTLRYQQFEDALQTGNAERIEKASESIAFIERYRGIVSVYDSIRQQPAFSVRPTHHDTKISNVLFDQEGRGLCVIDLDTTMPGYFISDVGDMMRTYLSPVSEEETDLSKISVRDEYFLAIAEGYLGQMKDELSAAEKAHFFYAGSFAIYMQALRFLSDYISNDVYYGARREHHNFDRARNQIVLLEQYLSKKDRFENTVQDLLKKAGETAASPVSVHPW